MSDSKFQISKKLNDGTIILIGADTSVEFANNLKDIIGEEGRDAVRALFFDLIPTSAGPTTPAPAQPVYTTPPAYPQQQQVQQSAPGQAPLCPNHQQPAKWVPPGISSKTNRPYQGFFACAVSQQGDNSCRIPR